MDEAPMELDDECEDTLYTTVEYYGLDEEQLSNVDLTKYRFVKRTPIRETIPGNNEIFVSSRSNHLAAVKKARKILAQEGSNSLVIIHGMGATTEKACNIAVDLVSSSNGSLVMSPTTSTVALIDDYEPLDASVEPFSQVRYNSAIHIRISPINRSNQQT